MLVPLHKRQAAFYQKAAVFSMQMICQLYGGVAYIMSWKYQHPPHSVWQVPASFHSEGKHSSKPLHIARRICKQHSCCEDVEHTEKNMKMVHRQPEKLLPPAPVGKSMLDIAPHVHALNADLEGDNALAHRASDGSQKPQLATVCRKVLLNRVSKEHVRRGGELPTGMSARAIKQTATGTRQNLRSRKREVSHLSSVARPISCTSTTRSVRGRCSSPWCRARGADGFVSRVSERTCFCSLLDVEGSGRSRLI